MSTKIPTIWPMQPHTEAKHKILKSYFGAWLSIIAQRYASLKFIDGFCGPGEYSLGEPGSPIVVLDEAERALQNGGGRIRTDLKLEMTFIDRDQARLAHLKSVLASRAKGDRRVVISEPLCGEFEDKVQPLLRSVEASAGNTPTLVFIDPFGVKGYTRQTIEKFLKIRSTEIFLLLDVDGIYRSLFAWEQNRKNVLAIFGEEHEKEIRQIAEAGLGADIAQDRLRKLFVRIFSQQHMAEYCLQFRMYASDKKPLFDLVFLTNNDKGFVEMKNAMWKSSDRDEFIFLDSEHTEIEQLRLGISSVQDILWKLLLGKFRGKQVTGQQITDFVEKRTIYLSRHKTTVLESREAETTDLQERITVTRVNPRGRRGFPPAALIQFPS